MFSSIKVVTAGVLVALLAILASGAVVTYLKNDHRLEIQLLQNARIGEGKARPTGQATASTGNIAGASPAPVVAPGTVSSEQVLSLGYRLMSDQNPGVRGEIAETFARLAAQRNTGSAEYGPLEAQMIDLLQSAYHREKDPAVRRKIVAGVAAFNHPQAVVLMEAAAQDQDPSVRQAAQEARRSREARLSRYGAADFRPTGWK
ncbi:MAG TPA: HEAT repeat domain-containing protein [Candidatus Obscuribacterales bacterium]